MSMNELEHITNGSNLENVSILIDYHYWDKNFKIYPNKNESQVSMIRVTSRFEDINKAITFSKKLKDYTGIDLSFQIINSSILLKSMSSTDWPDPIIYTFFLKVGRVVDLNTLTKL